MRLCIRSSRELHLKQQLRPPKPGFLFLQGAGPAEECREASQGRSGPVVFPHSDPEQKKPPQSLCPSWGHRAFGRDFQRHNLQPRCPELHLSLVLRKLWNQLDKGSAVQQEGDLVQHNWASEWNK